MEAEVPAVVMKYHEMYEQGFINGWCYSSETLNKYQLKNIDALLIYDQGIY